MPLETQLTYNLAEALGGAWGAVVQSQTQTPTWDPDVHIGAAMGYRYVQFQSTAGSGGAEQQTRYLYGPLASDQKATVRWMIATGQLGGTDAYNPYFPGRPGKEEMQAFWEAMFLPIIDDILDQWCDASVEDGSSFGIDFALGWYRSAAMYWKVTTDSECFVLTRNYIGADPPEDDTPDPITVNPAQAPMPASSVAVVPATADLAALTQAVQDIAHRTVVASINDNQSIAVLDAGEIISSGAPIT